VFEFRVTPLSKKSVAALIQFELAMAVLLFLPAWSLRFWAAWIYLGVSSASSWWITFHFLKHDPGLVERRLRAGPAAEKETSQKIILSAAVVLWCALIILPGLDHRFHWSSVPVPVVLAADALVVAGYAIVFRVFQENSFASSTVVVHADQRVISSGPYRLVRHPMYSGGALMLLATPLALGSGWDMTVAILLCAVIVIRLLHEERFLSRNLPGYAEYCAKVRCRLIPFVW
jgi:protein-S-isoprenylcysteine O-methyltransferase Ste14